MISGKVWGESRRIKSGTVELHRIEADSGGYCSKHFHCSKWNGFFVERGKLLVRVWQQSGLVDETTLVAGDYTEVPPGVYHQFECLEDAVAFELYWSELRGDDIQRESRGGRR